MNRPNILFVDDAADEVEVYTELIGDRAEVSIVHPGDVDADRLTASHLVLIDYKIDYWPAREDVRQVGLRPLTGVALAAVLRDYINYPKRNSSPVAFGILSGRIQELSRGLPVEHRRQVLAATNNLEWIFSKSESATAAEQAISLAGAVAALPKNWGTEDSADLVRGQLLELLDLRESNWQSRAIEDAERCHPPLHELSEWSHGMAIVRWLLHVILPYPCFLLDSLQLAQRLRVTPDSLGRALVQSAFQQVLRPSKYTGILSGFAGKRWWRSGVESVLWDGTGGRSFDVPVLHSLLKSISGDIQALSVDDPVICLDENYAGNTQMFSRRDAVRIQPDQWPSFAEPAWTTIELARGIPSLKALVIEQDRVVLNGGGHDQ